MTSTLVYPDVIVNRYLRSKIDGLDMSLGDIICNFQGINYEVTLILQDPDYYIVEMELVSWLL